MSSFSDYTENLVLNYVFTTNSVTRPTAWYVGLFTAAPSDSGGGTEVSGSGYARVATGTMSVSGTSPTNCTNSAAIAGCDNVGRPCVPLYCSPPAFGCLGWPKMIIESTMIPNALSEACSWAEFPG